MNKLIIIGNLGRDAEVRQLEGGTQVVSFNVAVTEKFKGRDGNMQEITTWFQCSRFINAGQPAWGVVPYLKKGTKVVVEGKASVRAYADKQGAPAASLELRVSEIELLGSATPGTGQTQAHPQAQAPAPQMVAQPVHTMSADEAKRIEDDLPF